jgi:hypothetical protein
LQSLIYFSIQLHPFITELTVIIMSPPNKTTLPHLHRDALKLITQQLLSTEIARLWISGDLQLQRQLLNGGVETFSIAIGDPKPHQQVWPSLLTLFPSIKEFSMDLTNFSGDVKWKQLPRGLRSLKLNFPEADTCLEEVSSRSFTPKKDQDTLASLFPELQTLESVTSSGLNKLKFPASLTVLNMPSFELFDHQTISSLPNLTNLNCSWRENSDSTSLVLPQHLTHLRIRECLSYNIFGSISSLNTLSLLVLTFQIDENEEGAEGMLKLPKSLTSLHLRLPTKTVPGFIKSLPSSLTKLHIDQEKPFVLDDWKCESPVPKLKVLKLYCAELSEKDEINTIKFLRLLPPNLESYKFSTGDYLGEKEWTTKELEALPRTLKSFSHEVELSNDANLSALPKSLTDLIFANPITITRDNVQHIPKGLHRLVANFQDVPGSQILPVLLNMPNLTYLEGVPIECFSNNVLDDLMQQRGLEVPPVPLSSKEYYAIHWIPNRWKNLDISVPPVVPVFLDFGTSKSDNSIQSSDGSPSLPLSLRDPYSALLDCNDHGHSQGVGLEQLSINSDLENAYDDRSVALSLLSPLPSSVTSFTVSEMRLEPAILEMLSNSSTLEDLQLGTFIIPLEDSHIQALPSSLQGMWLRGCASNITVNGLSSLPRSLKYVELMECPIADSQFDQGTDSTVLPPELKRFHIEEKKELIPAIPGSRRIRIVPSPWSQFFKSSRRGDFEYPESESEGELGDLSDLSEDEDQTDEE